MNVGFLIMFGLVFTLGFIGTVFAIPDLNQTSSVLSPLTQFKSGTPFDEIQCKEEFVLIQKYDDSPACVTLETKLKLIERGWTTTETSSKNNSLIAEEEVSLVQNHYGKMHAASLEKMKLENSSFIDSVTEQAKTKRILELESIIQDEIRMIEELQTEFQKKYALESDFEVEYAKAREILRSTPDSDDVPYLGMSLGDDRMSIVIGINSLNLTAEKDQQHYEKYIAERFEEITYPIKLVFHEPKGGDE